MNGSISPHPLNAFVESISEQLAVWRPRANSAVEVAELLGVDIVRFLDTDTTDGVSVWIGLSWAKL